MTKINREEYEILKELIGESVKWICRDEGGDLFVYEIKPNKGNVVWLYGDGNSEIRRISNSDLFQFIQWEDENPYNIAELIEEYEEHEFYDYVGWEYYKNGEAEVRKDIGWLKREIHKELEDWHGVEGGIDGDGINEIMSLINQHEESEIKRLDRKMKELESYNDELVRDNNQFRDELDSLDSQFMSLHTSYDEQIKSLEYELFVEKTREPKNKFYWFTAKKTPLIVDISYMSNENHFYGFKQVPNYHFIENHDLRFITNCSLDDLAEQFR